MFKFFRHIRKSLLNEGKTSKYFKYAIGEIVLVVIGILIALQINNWNGQNKKRNLKKEYQISLINDYTKDTIQLNDRLNRNKERFTLLSSTYDSIEKGYYKTIEDYTKLYASISAGIRVTNIYNTNSFNILISSGNIDLFDKEFRTELMELNRLQIAEQTVQNGNQEYLYKFMQNVSLKYPHAGSPFSRDKANQLLWKNVKIDDLPRDLTTLIYQEGYTIYRYIELTRDVVNQTELVLKLLHQAND